jgi:hypothetical protein
MFPRGSGPALTTIALALVGCGSAEPLSGRALSIVGGAPDLTHDYVVGLGNSRGIFCSGTVISKHTVLTAGHCIGGVTRVYFGPTLASATAIDVVAEVQDPMYADICDNDATYDLGVVKLAQPAPTQAAPLLRATLDNSQAYVGPPWVFVGYGVTANGGGLGVRRAVSFPIALVGPAAGRGSLCMIPDTLIYASTPGKNTCDGDSGGPSFWIGGGVEYLAGVTSSGDNNCVLDDTQQRSDQPYIDQFIQAQIDAFEGADPCRADGQCNESCNGAGQVGDPDCAAAHCGADGICSRACVAPVDPDCALEAADAGATEGGAEQADASGGARDGATADSAGSAGAGGAPGTAASQGGGGCQTAPGGRASLSIALIAALALLSRAARRGRSLS